MEPGVVCFTDADLHQAVFAIPPQFTIRIYNQPTIYTTITFSNPLPPAQSIAEPIGNPPHYLLFQLEWDFDEYYFKMHESIICQKNTPECRSNYFLNYFCCTMRTLTANNYWWQFTTNVVDS
jgi:hypothetical protein